MKIVIGLMFLLSVVFAEAKFGKEYYLLYEVSKQGKDVGMYRVKVNNKTHKIYSQMYGKLPTAKIPVVSNKEIDKIYTKGFKNIAFADGKIKFDIYSAKSALSEKQQRKFKKIVKKVNDDNLLIVTKHEKRNMEIGFSEKVLAKTFEEFLVDSIEKNSYTDKLMLFDKEGILKKIVTAKDVDKTAIFNNKKSKFRVKKIGIKNKTLFSIFSENTQGIPVLIESSKWKFTLIGAGQYKTHNMKISELAYKKVEEANRSLFHKIPYTITKKIVDGNKYKVNYEVDYQYPSDNQIVLDYLKVKSSKKLDFKSFDRSYVFSVNKTEICQQLNEKNEKISTNCTKKKNKQPLLTLKTINKTGYDLVTNKLFYLGKWSIKKANCELSVEKDNVDLICKDSGMLNSNEDYLLEKLKELNILTNMFDVRIESVNKDGVTLIAKTIIGKKTKPKSEYIPKEEVELYLKNDSVSAEEIIEKLEKSILKNYYDVKALSITKKGIKLDTNVIVSVSPSIIKKEAEKILFQKVGRKVKAIETKDTFIYKIDEKVAKKSMCSTYLKQIKKSPDSVKYVVDGCKASYSANTDKNTFDINVKKSLLSSIKELQYTKDLKINSDHISYTVLSGFEGLKDACFK